jgi:hypothetical protein
MKIPFDNIARTEYIRYLRKAQYLISRGYVLDHNIDLFQLAEMMYNKDCERKNEVSNNK